MECRYYEAYHSFIKEAFDEADEDEDDMEIADVFSFWTEQKAKFGHSKPFTRSVAASIYNSSLYTAYGLVKEGINPWMAKSYTLNAAFLRQCCEKYTSIDDMVEWYEIGSEGAALCRFLSRVPHLKAGYDAISSNSILAYLEAREADNAQIVGCTLLESEVLVSISDGKEKGDQQFCCGLSQDIKPHLNIYAKKKGIQANDLRITFKNEDDTVISISPEQSTTPKELGMQSRGKYTINVSAVTAKERRAQEVIARFVSRSLRMRKVRRILARNIIADVIWRHREHKARMLIAEFIWHHHQQRQARKTITDFVWQIIAMQRRRKLRSSAIIVQTLFRGHSTRKVYLEPLQLRLEQFRQFKAIWEQTVASVPISVQTLTGWAQVRERINVKKVELMDEDGNLADTDKKLNEALTSALNDNNTESTEDEEDLNDDFTEVTVEENHADVTENLAKIDWSQFQVTAHVVKFMKNGDAKYREIFVKKMKQLAKGERSHKLQKPLVGCKSIIYETYLENKSGFRILWTEEGGRLVVWFIAKHKVPM